MIKRGPNIWFARRVHAHCEPSRGDFCFRKVNPRELPQAYVNRALEVRDFAAADLCLSSLPLLVFLRCVGWQEAVSRISLKQSIYAAEHSEEYCRLPFNRE